MESRGGGESGGGSDGGGCMKERIQNLGLNLNGVYG